MLCRRRLHSKLFRLQNNSWAYTPACFPDRLPLSLSVTKLLYHTSHPFRRLGVHHLHAYSLHAADNELLVQNPFEFISTPNGMNKTIKNTFSPSPLLYWWWQEQEVEVGEKWICIISSAICECDTRGFFIWYVELQTKWIRNAMKNSYSSLPWISCTFPFPIGSL